MNDRISDDLFFARLRELILDLAGAAGLEDGLGRILQAALDCGTVDCGGVYLLENDGALHLVAARGLDEGFAERIRTYAADSPQASIVNRGVVWRWSGDDLAALRVADTARGPIRSLATLPILLQGRPVGSFNLASRQVEVLPDAVLARCELLCALATTTVVRSRARRELEAREAMFRNLYEKMPLPYQSLDAAGNLLEVNEAWQKLFGYARAEVLGHSIAEFLDESSLPTLAEEFPAFKARGFVGGPEFIIHPRQGGPRQVAVNGRASYDENGEFLRTHCLLTDVTEQRRQDAETRALMAEQRLIIDNAMVGLAVFRDRRFVSCNEHFVALLGYQRDELIGQSAEIVHRDRQHFLDRGRRIYAALADGLNFDEEECFRRKDGGAVWLHVTGRAVDPAHPVEEASVWIFIDVTRRRQAEAMMRGLNEDLERRVAQRTAELTQANRDLEGFSYSVSHDLRAPLRAINGFARLLIENEHAQLSEDGRHMLERITHNSNRMGELIDDILEYSRAGRVSMARRTVDLDPLARTVAAELGEAYPAARIEIAPLTVVRGDSVMLRQVLENLIGNALKYSVPQVEPRVEIGCSATDGACTVSVRDNGVGFDMRYADKLFGMFQRLHTDKEFPGTGVGLAIVKRIIERHGGTIRAESAPGAGATFRFTLPLADNRCDPPASPHTSPDRPV